jgi:type II secretion system protein C
VANLVLVFLLLLAAAPADLRVTGVVVSGHDGSSVAVLHAGERARVVRVGETAFGGRVVSIARDGVVLEFDGERVGLGLTPGEAPAPPPSAPAAAEGGGPGRVLERAELERRLAEEVPRILAETSLVRVTGADGQVAGFTLTRVPEGSLLTEAGLRAGDVLTSINDTPIDSVATLMALYPRLRDEAEIRAEVIRDGRPLSLRVTLK